MHFFNKKLDIIKLFRNINNLDKYYNDLSKKLDYTLLVQSTGNLHREVFSKYKNINRGKDAVLIATGPSLKDFKPFENAVYIGVNRAFQYNKIKFDYMFLQDYSGSIDYIEDFLNYEPEYTKKFLGFTDFKYTKHCIIPEKYSSYKNVERYYTASHLLKENFTFDITAEPFYDRYSIVFPAMQFILWTHPDKIYIAGCDCDLNGYYDDKSSKNNLEVNEIIEGWKDLKIFIETYYPDIEIISVNPKGLKGLFKDEYC